MRRIAFVLFATWVCSLLPSVRARSATHGESLLHDLKIPRQPQTGDWHLVFSDEFDGPNGSAPNANNWAFEEGYIRNEEMQYYTTMRNNSYVADGRLHLVALDTPVEVAPGVLAPVTSASVFTVQAFTYGKIEARLQVPPGTGVWPAFWMLGADINTVGWPMCGEIDIMEFVGFQPGFTHATLHYEANNSMRNNEPTKVYAVPTITTEFHNYTAVWTPYDIQMLVDGVPMFRVNNSGSCSPVDWPFNRPFNIKINLAIGGSWGGQHGVKPSIFPATYLVDYVRVYQNASLAPPACVFHRRYLLLSAVDQATTSEVDIATNLLSEPAAAARFTALLEEALRGLVSDVGQPVSSFTASVQALVPYRHEADNKVKLLVNFTWLNTAEQTDVDHVFENLNAVQLVLQEAIRYLTQAVVPNSSNSTTAFVVEFAGDATNCPGCFDGPDGAPTPRPFQKFSVPSSFPFAKYDFGGEGVGYHDSTVWNQYGLSVARAGADGVDIAADAIGVGYAIPGEWLKYSGFRTSACAQGSTTTTTAAASQPLSLFVTAANAQSAPGVVAFSFRALTSSAANTSAAVYVEVTVLPTGSWSSFVDSSPVDLTLTCDTAYEITATFPASAYLLGTFTINNATVSL